MNWPLLLFLLLLVIWLENYKSKYPNSRISRFFNTKRDLTKQSRKELMYQAKLYIKLSGFCLLLFGLLGVLMQLKIIPVSLQDISVGIFSASFVIALILGIFSFVCFLIGLSRSKK